MEPLLTDLCIYAIKHSANLHESVSNGGRGTYTEQKKWTRAKELLERAKGVGERLPIIFSPAEETFQLIAWALIDEIVPGETTRYRFSELRLLLPPPRKTTLIKARDGKALSEYFIRSYAICRTPNYLVPGTVPAPKR